MTRYCIAYAMWLIKCHPPKYFFCSLCFKCMLIFETHQVFRIALNMETSFTIWCIMWLGNPLNLSSNRNLLWHPWQYNITNVRVSGAEYVVVDRLFSWGIRQQVRVLCQCYNWQSPLCHHKRISIILVVSITTWLCKLSFAMKLVQEGRVHWKKRASLSVSYWTIMVSGWQL